MSLRVTPDGNLMCLPIGVASNRYYLGGFAGGTYADYTHHVYLAEHGWDSPLTTFFFPWTTYAVSRTEEELVHVKNYHAQIFEQLFSTLS